MSNRAARAQRRTAQEAKPHLTLRGETVGRTPTPTPLPRRERRKMARTILKEHGRVIVQPVSEEDIPPGSVLSDATLTAIREGNMALRQVIPKSGPPVKSKAESIRRKRRAERDSRRRNRAA